MERILEDIRDVIEDENGKVVRIIIPPNQGTQIDDLDKLIIYEVKLAVNFYFLRNKINLHQAEEIKIRATNRLIGENVITKDKIKQVVKDYIIRVLSRDLQNAIKNKNTYN